MAPEARSTFLTRKHVDLAHGWRRRWSSPNAQASILQGCSQAERRARTAAVQLHPGPNQYCCRPAQQQPLRRCRTRWPVHARRRPTSCQTKPCSRRNCRRTCSDISAGLGISHALHGPTPQTRDWACPDASEAPARAYRISGSTVCTSCISSAAACSRCWHVQRPRDTGQCHPREQQSTRQPRPQVPAQHQPPLRRRGARLPIQRQGVAASS